MFKPWQTLDDVNINNKIVLLRQDLNVPIDSGVISNDTRIQKALPAIQAILDKGAGVFLVSHLGRPKPGQREPELSLQPVAIRLSELLERPVRFEAHWENGVSIQPGEVVLGENIRYYPGETDNDEQLAKQLATVADVFVIDAFGTAHRRHASTVGVGAFLPAVAGPLLNNELEALSAACRHPKKPVVAIVGGSKVSSKLKVLKSLVKKMDAMILGGGIANTFLAAKGYSVGDSLYEPELLETARHIQQEANASGCELLLPSDVVVSESISDTAVTQERLISEVQPQDKILDIGQQTCHAYANYLQSAQTILWNGPVGVFEIKQFSHGTESLAKAIAENTGFSIAGGGDTLAAIDMFQVKDRISYISTGGGAFLAFLEDEPLPVVEMLEHTINS